MSMRVYFEDDPCPHCGRFDDVGEEQLTYNYSGICWELVQRGALPDGEGEYARRMLGFLEGKRAGKVAGPLLRAVKSLSRDGEKAGDCWGATEGNVRAALQRLLDKCKKHPNARLRTSR